MQTYTLDLETLLALLEESGQTGHLSTELSSGIPGLKERCQVRIDLQEGKIAACQLRGMNGRVIAAGSQALQLLSHLGSREWQLVETRPAEAFPHAAPAPAYLPDIRNQRTLSVVPRRIAYIDQRALERLSRRHRRVLSLVDDVRSVEKIAALLSTSPDAQFLQQVNEIVQELAAMGMIII